MGASFQKKDKEMLKKVKIFENLDKMHKMWKRFENVQNVKMFWIRAGDSMR